MVDEMPIHPTLFRFMSVLNDSILQHTETVIAQTNSGTFLKKKQSRAQTYLQETAAQMETSYKRGLLSATAVLQHAAEHYTDRLVEEVMNNTDLTDLQEQREEDDDDTVDERQRALEEDSELEDNDPDNWITSNWPEITMPRREGLPLLPHEDPAKVCCITCSVCYSAPDVMTLLKSCKHAFCKTCYRQMTSCPRDRIAFEPLGEVFMSSFIIARREEVENNYGVTEEQMQQADELNGQRVADQTEAEIMREMMQEAVEEDLRVREIQDARAFGIPRPYSHRLTRTSTDRSGSSRSSSGSSTTTNESSTNSDGSSNNSTNNSNEQMAGNPRISRLRRTREPSATITQPQTQDETRWTTSRLLQNNSGRQSPSTRIDTSGQTPENNRNPRNAQRPSRNNNWTPINYAESPSTQQRQDDSDEDFIPATQPRD